MAMVRYRIVHTTEYRFSRAVSKCVLTAMLRPRDILGLQKTDLFQMVTRPLADGMSGHTDGFGNHVTQMEFQGELQRLLVSANSTVTLAGEAPEEGPEPGCAGGPDYLQATALVPLSADITAYARRLVDGPADPITAAEETTRQIYEDIAYRPSVTDITTSARHVLESRQGVCQDLAHLAIAVMRSLGLPARYVSGYVHTAAFRGMAHRMAADASHAWFEVFDARYGWKGFDPTNGRRVDENYIVVALGRDYDDVCPLKGTFKGGGKNALNVSVDVQRIGAE